MPIQNAATTSQSPARAMRCLAGSARRSVQRCFWAVQDHRLSREQAQQVLGPAHRQWQANAASENERRWSNYDWSRSGEEWNASPEWKQALIDDVLSRFIPAGAVTLEIGPGAGRWTATLSARASRLILADVSKRPLELCRERFGEACPTEYVLSSGSDLPGVADGSIEAAWSFDAFVHIAPSDQAGYLQELSRVLVPGGIAVLHHADGRNRGQLPSRAGWRSPMSRGLFAALATERGLTVECQLDSWGPGGRYDLSAFADAITVCRAPGAQPPRPTVADR